VKIEQTLLGVVKYHFKIMMENTCKEKKRYSVYEKITKTRLV